MEFIEAPAFTRHLARYLDDEQYRQLQDTLAGTPELSDVMPGTGGFRKPLGGRSPGQRPSRWIAGHLLLVRRPKSNLAYDRLRQE